MQRLDKTVSQYGNMTRSEATKLIRGGKVTVDGTVCRDPAVKIDPALCGVEAAGRRLCCREHLYVMLNKPAGILCVSSDEKERTVVDLLPPELKRAGMFPAGRLDKDTVGLVLLTDDGDYGHRLTAPVAQVYKTYRAAVAGEMPPGAAGAFAAGIILSDGTRCLPAGLRILSRREFGDLPEEFTGPVSFCEIRIREGKYHQVKRMCAALGNPVLFLRRIAIGNLWLEGLSEGECRLLDQAEIRLPWEPVENICAF